MSFHPVPHRRRRRASFPVLDERRHVGRRRRRRRAEDVAQEPLAADDRRRSRRIRGDRQDASVSEQSLPIWIGQLHPAEAGAVYVRHAVEPRQPLVQECVVRCQELGRGPIVPDLTIDEQLGLTQERFSQVVVEVGERGGVWRHVLQVSQRKPLREEVLDPGRRFRVGDHSPHLLLQNLVVAQLPGARLPNQLLVGDRAPEKERESRRQIDIRDAKRGILLGDHRRRLFHAE